MKRISVEAVWRTEGGIALAVASMFLLAGCAAPTLPPITVPTSEPPAVASQAPAPPPASAKPMDLGEAIERAAAHNTQLRALRAAVVVAKERRSAATDFEDPEALGAWGNIGDEFSNFSPTGNNHRDWRLGARLYVPNPFQISPRVSARAAELLAAKADLQAASWLVECEVRRSFAELDFLRQDLALAEDLLRINGEILRDVRARSEQGAATASELVAASQKQVQAQEDLALTRHRYQLAQRELAGLLELPPANLHLATNGLSYPFFTEGADAFGPLLQGALQRRGDITALRWRALAARSTYQEARNARVPWLKELTVWNREPGDEWWAGAAVSVPIFSWTKNHAEDVLQAQYKLAGVNETNGIQLACRELRDAWDELAEQRRQQARNQTEIVPLLGEMQQTLRVLKATPHLMSSQVATTEAQIVESSRVELASRWRYHLALLNLERAFGGPLSELPNAPRRKM